MEYLPNPVPGLFPDISFKNCMPFRARPELPPKHEGFRPLDNECRLIDKITTDSSDMQLSTFIKN